MRSTPRYPVDRYLVESSNKIEMVNIMDDDIWAPEPALRPEDEIILRKLHDMLQSTADDLKLLSGELAKFHQPGVQLKTQPLPLDEEFNEKVHIEELVNAKFHGYKIIDKPSSLNARIGNSKPVSREFKQEPVKKPVFKNLGITRTRILEIDEKIDNNKKSTEQKLNNGRVVNVAPSPAVAYSEFTYKYVEPKVKLPQQRFKIQDMPSVNIRSELKQQKVLQLDIFPESEVNPESKTTKSNVSVVAVEHEVAVAKPNPKITLTKEHPAATPTLPVRQLPQTYITKHPIRKVSKMSTYESSESANISSDTLHNIKTQKIIKSVIKSSPKTSARDRTKIKKTNVTGNESDKRTRLNIDEWKRKLNTVYGMPSTSKNTKNSKQLKKSSPKKPNLPSSSKPVRSVLNNAEYIPYSKLTLGGVRVSDIERELSKIPNKSDVPLIPILDKILSSRENSFRNESPKRKSKKKDSPRVFTTSDENLLQEVINIENKVSKTIGMGKTISKTSVKPKDKIDDKPEVEELQLVSSASMSDNDNKESYADDFEDEKSESAEKSASSHSHNENNEASKGNNSHSDADEPKSDEAQADRHNKTNNKQSNLSIKKTVDIFEFVHSVDTQDIAIQSNATNKISLKETQTSPKVDQPNVQPIHNDLWEMDPKGNVEKMFKLEKDFIKKLILDEYGEFFEKSITKPSTSKASTEEQVSVNVTASQKVTQTSPAHVKSVMTSPTRTKTRTTSPFLSLKVDHQTSPVIVVTNEDHVSVELDDDEEGISINLSSPRFSLRLPQTSREVLSNLEGASASQTKKQEKEDEVVKAKRSRTYRKSIICSSSSSSEVENSSEISSLGEVKFKLKRRLRKVSSISESSESSQCSSGLLTGSILPLRSEGEVSLGQLMKKVSNKARKNSRSEGETSLRRPK